MPVSRVSLGARMMDRVSRVFRNPYVRVGATALGLGFLATACRNDKVMDLPDPVGKGSWTAVADHFARVELKLEDPSELLKAELANCFSAANGGKKPEDAIVGEDGVHITPPDAACVGLAVLASQAGVIAPQVAAPVVGETPAAPKSLNPVTLEPLPPISITIENLLRKGKVTPVTIEFPAGFKVDPAALGTIFEPMEQDVDIALVRVDAGVAPVLTGQTLTGYGLKPGDRFKWNTGLPLSVSFQVLGSRVQAGTEDTCEATANGTPQVLALNINAFEAVQGGGGHHSETVTPEIHTGAPVQLGPGEI